MTTKTEQLPHDEGFIVSEANGNLSREQVTIVPRTSAYEAGTVMSKRDDGKYEHFDPGSSEQPDVPTVIGVLCQRVDTSNGAGGVGSEKKGVIIERLAEVRAADLIWIGCTTAEQATGEARFLVQNIKLRTAATRTETQTT
jgi:hypothetical protein